MKLFSTTVAVLTALMTSVGASPKTDRDWTWSGQPNCPHPQSDSAQWIEEAGRRFIRFQLRDGDIGGCPTDNDRAHSAAYDRPHSERAEWTGHAFQNDGRAYHISFDVRFVQGFDQDQLTATYFQIKDCPTSRVPVIAKLGGWQKEFGGRAKMAFSLGTQSRNEQYHSQFLNEDPVDNAWHRVDAFYQTGPTHSLKVTLDGETMLPETQFANVFTCGRPRLHVGIYRAGVASGNSHSIVDYDRIRIEPVQPSQRLSGNGRWTFGGGQGRYESGTTDGAGNAISFSCDDLGQNGGLSIELGGRPVAQGPVRVDVDGEIFDMHVTGQNGLVDTLCPECQANYKALWGASSAGARMTIASSDNLSVEFSLHGSQAALGDVACTP